MRIKQEEFDLRTIKNFKSGCYYSISSSGRVRFNKNKDNQCGWWKVDKKLFQRLELKLKVLKAL